MKQGRRRFIRRVAMVCSVMLAGLFISWLLVRGPGIVIPLDGFRNPIQAAISRALGRDVRMEGALALRLAPGPTIVARDVRVAGPAGQQDLLTAGRVALRLAPAALLRGELRGVRLLIEDAGIDLDTREGVARGTALAEPGGASAGVYPRLLATSARLLSKQPDLRELVLRRVVLNCRDEDAVPACQVRLDEASIHTQPGQPLGLVFRGRFQQQPYTVDLTGGRLADLLAPGGGGWPLRAGVSFADARLLLDGNLEVSRQGFVMPFELRVDWPAAFARVAASFGQVPLAGRLSLLADHGRPVVAGELQLPRPGAVLRFGAGAGPAGDAADQPAHSGEVLAGRTVSVPLTVSIADVPFHGQLTVAAQGAEPVAELALSTADASADGLMATLTGTSGIRGRFRHIGFQASVRGGGETVMANRVALALQVEGARLSYGNDAGNRPVDVTLDELALTLPAGQPVMLQARGALLDEDVAVKLTAGGLEVLLSEAAWPVTLTATGGGAVLDVSGPLAIARGDTTTRLLVGLYGERIGDLAAWLGVSACAAASYTLRGQLVLAEDIGRLQFLQLQTGGTRLNGDLDWSGDDRIALLHAVLHFEELDPADIEALIPLMRQDSGEGAARGIAIDIPVLPGRVEIVNADVDLDIAHILHELVDITEVSLSAQIREGRLQRSPFHAHIGNISFQGHLDPEAAETAVVFENEDHDSATGGWMDKLFSSAVRWAGSTAVVPLRWVFRKKFSAGKPADCQARGVEAGN